MSAEDKLFAQIIRRIDMMLARGVLRATADGGGIQRMQVGVLEGELADNVERFQSYGVSSVPPNGGDVLIAFVQGNRDHGVVVAVNDRGSRPKGLTPGEVVLYNDKDCSVRLTTDGDVVVSGTRDVLVETARDVTVRTERHVTVRTIQGNVLIETEEGRIDLNAPLGVFANGAQIG